MTETMCFFAIYGDLIFYVNHYAGRAIPMNTDSWNDFKRRIILNDPKNPNP